MRRVSTSCASGSGAVTRRIGSSAKNSVPSGMAWTSPVKRNPDEIIEEAPAEPAAPGEPVDLFRREPQVFQEVERRREARRHEEAAPRRQLAEEELEHRRAGEPMLEIGLEHVELIEIGQQRARIAVHGDMLRKAARAGLDLHHSRGPGGR